MCINIHDTNDLISNKISAMCNRKTLTVLLITVFISKSLQLNVNCEYNKSSKITLGRQKWKVVTDPYSCVLTTLDIKSKLNVTNITGTHLQGNTNSDMKAVKIIGGGIIPSGTNTSSDTALKVMSSCEIIPSGLGSIFPNIEALTVWRANLKSVSSSDLHQFSNLREIWLFVNALEYLESKLFEFNPKVEVISFNSNHIKFIGGNFFDHLPLLQKAYFYYNDCITGEATDTDKLNAMKEKIKEECSVSEITESLQVTVDCEYEISADWEVVNVPYVCTLKTLDIRKKLSVSNVTGTHFSGSFNSDIRAVNINGGICHIIPSYLGAIFPNLEAFSVWNASLKIVTSRDLQQFVNLREIWLNANEIDYLESNLFEYNPKIEIVTFSCNNIKYVGGTFFDYLPHLKMANFWNNDCINSTASTNATLISIKEEIKDKCAVLGPEPRGYTTIRPDGLTYWFNGTATEADGEGVGGIKTDAEANFKVLGSLVG